LLGIGPTGSGKTSGTLYPTLMTGWSHSALVWDFKDSIWRDTGAQREQAGKVIVLDITRRGGPRYNPLMEIRDGDHLVPDAQHVARILSDAGKNVKSNPFFQDCKYSLLTGVILHAITALPDSEKSIGGMRRFLVKGDDGLAEMMRPDAHPTAQRIAREIWSRAEKDVDGPEVEDASGGENDKAAYLRKSIYMTCSVALSDWEADVLDHQTAVSDFSVSDLVCGPEPVTLFIVSNPVAARRWHRVYRLIFSQMIDLLSMDRDTLPDGRRREWGALVAIDEFLELHLDEVSEWIKYVRDRRLRLMLLAQSLKEVEEEYGCGLTANCITLTLKPKNSHEAELMQTMAGDSIQEVPTKTVSRRTILDLPTVSRGTRIDRRPVLQANDALAMDRSDLILWGYGKPIRGQVIRYWVESPWKELEGPPTTGWTPMPNANPWFGRVLPARETLKKGLGAKPAAPKLRTTPLTTKPKTRG
jgi:type IV secretion system protein VirD4